jgi:hypothetical protein
MTDLSLPDVAFVSINLTSMVMRTFNLLSILLVGSLAIASCTSDEPTAPRSSTVSKPAKTKLADGVFITPIGDPIWKPIDAHIISFPMGTVDDGYAEFGESIAAMLPPPNHSTHAGLGVSPGAPHSDYTHELADGITANGFDEGVHFTPEQFGDGMGVGLVWMVVPDPGETGTSPDFASGAVIPNSLFPIHVVGDADHVNKDWDPYIGTFDVPALDGALDPDWASMDGHSHFPMFIADEKYWAPAGSHLPGQYVYSITMTDTEGNGWLIEAKFTIGG